MAFENKLNIGKFLFIYFQETHQYLNGKKLLTRQKTHCHTKKKVKSKTIDFFLSDFCALTTPKNRSPHQKVFIRKKKKRE
jgi:hypothetical protein